VTPPPAASAAPAAAPEPTAEEKKKAEEAEHLQADRAKFQEDSKAEIARWTPEMHASAKALADKSYPDLASALKAAMAGTDRKPGNAARDKFRHPVETLSFFGVKPTSTVIELAPGEGWYTELLAPALAAKGKLIATNGDPRGPEDQRGTLYAQRYQAFLDKAPELFGKVQTLVVDSKAPKLDVDGKADVVLLMREVHGFLNQGSLDAWLAEIHKSLKNGGVLGIEQHRAKADGDPAESAKNGYVPEKWLIEHVEAAGFKLTGKSEVNANAKDTKDYPEGVWALPPTFRRGDKDHEQLAAIGESDRMTLKFVKVAEKSAAAAKAAAAPKAPAAPATAPAAAARK
jgi:predicted methyltransferase